MGNWLCESKTHLGAKLYKRQCVLFLKEALKSPVLNYYTFPVWAYLRPTILLSVLIFHFIAAYIPLCVYQFQACVLCTFIWYIYIFFKATDIAYIQWSILRCKKIRRAVGQLVREEACKRPGWRNVSTYCQLRAALSWDRRALETRKVAFFTPSTPALFLLLLLLHHPHQPPLPSPRTQWQQ